MYTYKLMHIILWALFIIAVSLPIGDNTRLVHTRKILGQPFVAIQILASTNTLHLEKHA